MMESPEKRFAGWSLTLAIVCGTVKEGRLGSPGRLHCLANGRQQVERAGGHFLLFIFTFKVGKSYKNSIDYVSGTSDHCNDNFHYHVSLLQSSIPACTGRVLETNRQKSQGTSHVLFYHNIFVL